MKAAVTTEDHGFDIVDMPDPVPEVDQLVVRVAASGYADPTSRPSPSHQRAW